MKTKQNTCSIFSSSAFKGRFVFFSEVPSSSWSQEVKKEKSSEKIEANSQEIWAAKQCEFAKSALKIESLKTENKGLNDKLNGKDIVDWADQFITGLNINEMKIGSSFWNGMMEKMLKSAEFKSQLTGEVGEIFKKNFSLQRKLQNYVAKKINYQVIQDGYNIDYIKAGQIFRIANWKLFAVDDKNRMASPYWAQTVEKKRFDTQQKAVEQKQWISSIKKPLQELNQKLNQKLNFNKNDEKILHKIIKFANDSKDQLQEFLNNLGTQIKTAETEIKALYESKDKIQKNPFWSDSNFNQGLVLKDLTLPEESEIDESIFEKESELEDLKKQSQEFSTMLVQLRSSLQQLYSRYWKLDLQIWDLEQSITQTEWYLQNAESLLQTINTDLAWINQIIDEYKLKQPHNETFDQEKTHTVVSGDSYWKIAKAYYWEDGWYYVKDLQKANNNKSLYPGDEVKVPPLSQLTKKEKQWTTTPEKQNSKTKTASISTDVPK